MIITAILQGTEMVTKDWSGIIESASKSPLGILALMILVLGSLGVVFFKNADAKIKAVIYLAMLGGVIGYGVAVCVPIPMWPKSLPTGSGSPSWMSIRRPSAMPRSGLPSEASP